jgi:hypothetical protein
MSPFVGTGSTCPTGEVGIISDGIFSKLLLTIELDVDPM